MMMTVKYHMWDAFSQYEKFALDIEDVEQDYDLDD